MECEPRLFKPLVPAPAGCECSNSVCKVRTASAWRRNPAGGWLCNACGIFFKTRGFHRPLSVIEMNRTAKRRDTELAKASQTPRVRRKIRRKKRIKESTNVKMPESSQLELEEVQAYNDEPLPWEQKDYLKCGLYSIDLKLNDREKSLKGKDKVTTSELFPLPTQYGQFLITDQRNFCLPWDIMTAHKQGLLQRGFKNIKTNIFVDRKRKQDDEPIVCNCKPCGEGEIGCAEECVNRIMFYECSPKYCPCGEQCSNQRFQRKESVKKVKTKNRGFGLRTLDIIKKGQLILEYRGEIISKCTARKRMEAKYLHRKSVYFLEYGKGEVVDGAVCGTLARFINHSCAPNCHIEKWRAPNSEHFIGVFASNDIKPGTELTYDYNFSTFGGAQEQECFCGAHNCRGWIGGKHRSTNIIVRE
ncbi:13723_t:CDS:2 [Dentiscutata erythropus]|uniref:13723_t:CDS:1 n=1 Tax=Dentiscutata erythropus TaxID=1348616 RepID=A0A9N9HX92_9GLOM|nr:13723_t:CDS:2 [Dentiscutata erythropus]